jgi:hypothetical protein
MPVTVAQSPFKNQLASDELVEPVLKLLDLLRARVPATREALKLRHQGASASGELLPLLPGPATLSRPATLIAFLISSTSVTNSVPATKVTSVFPVTSADPLNSAWIAAPVPLLGAKQPGVRDPWPETSAARTA